MKLPSLLLDSLEEMPGFERRAFEAAHDTPAPTSVRLNTSKISVAESTLPIANRIPWTEQGYYLTERPSFTFDPLFHAGTYYVQEASSMFLEQAVTQSVDLSRSIRTLDLCAAPGGKSTHLQSLLSADSLLVSNEVIRARANVLKENIIKWGSPNVVVTNNDPRDFSRLESYFDLIVVDAPCSGSGLFRRDEEAIQEWSPDNVMLCSKRQQRILADAWPALKENGILIYSTCSYSKQEDEDILEWLIRDLQAEPVSLIIDKSWGIVEVKTPSGAAGYRFWPDKTKGEGFFLAVVRKISGEEPPRMRIRQKATPLTRAEESIIHKWVNPIDLHFIKHLDTVYAWPGSLATDINFILNQLRVTYSGTIIGELMKDKLIPDHALAMSRLVKAEITRTSLPKEQAIDYLKRKEIFPATEDRGWQLVTYEGKSLGWMNVLPNRINNYYPKELRILKDK